MDLGVAIVLMVVVVQTGILLQLVRMIGRFVFLSSTGCRLFSAFGSLFLIISLFVIAQEAL